VLRETPLSPTLSLPMMMSQTASASHGRPEPQPLDDIDALIEHRKAFLTGYQDAAYADRYTALVDSIRAKETSVVPGSTALTAAVAREYFRLLAYKDEYEVARLFTQSGFIEQLQADYEGPMRLSLHLAPPLLSRIDPTSGRPRKLEFGPWIFVALRLLARLRRLRGGPLDLFGYGRERRMERQLLRDYEALLTQLGDELDAARLPLAVAIADLPKEIRGFGPVKAAAVARAASRRAELLAEWRAVGVAARTTDRAVRAQRSA